MKHVDELRDPVRVRRLARQLEGRVTRPWVLMEVCGGQTHAIVRFGIDQLLPAGLELIHGPGCPVCVTPISLIDAAQAVALHGGVTLASFGDMLRVPGSRLDLLAARARGADVRVVYSPLDAVALAAADPSRQVVFFGVGFETTAPATAQAVLEAERQGLTNFSMLASHVMVPPALRALLASPDCRVQGFLAAGHVCAVTGLADYAPIAAESGRPIVVCGFEPVDMLEAIVTCVDLLEAGEARVVNAYPRVVRDAGNVAAWSMVMRVYEPHDMPWRGLGTIPRSGLRLRTAYARYDAALRFADAVAAGAGPDSADDAPDPCWSGRIMQGLARPPECPHFGTACTPDRPMGAPMVSSEGACAAWYRYRSEVVHA